MEIDYTYFQNALDRVKHTTSVEAFYHEFHVIQSLFSFVYPEIPEAHFALKFAYGLQAKFQSFVLQFNPLTTMEAYRLALIFEESMYLGYFPEMELTDDESYGINAVENHIEDSNVVSVMKADLSSESTNFIPDNKSGLVEKVAAEMLIGDSAIDRDVLQTILVDSAVIRTDLGSQDIPVQQVDMVLFSVNQVVAATKSSSNNIISHDDSSHGNSNSKSSNVNELWKSTFAPREAISYFRWEPGPIRLCFCTSMWVVSTKEENQWDGLADCWFTNSKIYLLSMLSENVSIVPDICCNSPKYGLIQHLDYSSVANSAPGTPRCQPLVDTCQVVANVQYIGLSSSILLNRGIVLFDPDDSDVGGCVLEFLCRGTDDNFNISRKVDAQVGMYDLTKAEWQTNSKDSKGIAAVDVKHVVAETLVAPFHVVSDLCLKNIVEDSSYVSPLWAEVGIEKVASSYNLSPDTSEGDQLEEEPSAVSHQVQQLEELPLGIQQPGTTFWESMLIFSHEGTMADMVRANKKNTIQGIPFKVQQSHREMVKAWRHWLLLYGPAGTIGAVSSTNCRCSTIATCSCGDIVRQELSGLVFEPGGQSANSSLQLSSIVRLFLWVLRLSFTRVSMSLSSVSISALKQRYGVMFIFVLETPVATHLKYRVFYTPGRNSAVEAESIQIRVPRCKGKHHMVTTNEVILCPITYALVTIRPGSIAAKGPQKLTHSLSIFLGGPMMFEHMYCRIYIHSRDTRVGSKDIVHVGIHPVWYRNVHRKPMNSSCLVMSYSGPIDGTSALITVWPNCRGYASEVFLNLMLTTYADRRGMHDIIPSTAEDNVARCS